MRQVVWRVLWRCWLWVCLPASAADGPDCSRPLSLVSHDQGLLYSADIGAGIDRDVADELIRRIGCRVHVSPPLRARLRELTQVIKFGAIRRDGTMLRIFEKYFKSELARAMVLTV